MTYRSKVASGVGSKECRNGARGRSGEFMTSALPKPAVKERKGKRQKIDASHCSPARLHLRFRGLRSRQGQAEAILVAYDVRCLAENDSPFKAANFRI
jgi:hypothetical protein